MCSICIFSPLGFLRLDETLSLSQFVAMCTCLRESYNCLREWNQFSTDSKAPHVLHDSYLLLCGERQRHQGWDGWSDRRVRSLCLMGRKTDRDERVKQMWRSTVERGKGREKGREDAEDWKARDNIRRLWETDGEIKRERQRTSAERKEGRG